ncbi:MFS transporter [Microbacterium radiodurans]|uniref:MFS transporter n=1 Tax=Microbacterium radiodurans TaxID=661398 RepID=A0A5J5IZ85_9MICO|nr:MFS transporter [Microbacterium radiodurans]
MATFAQLYSPQAVLPFVAEEFGAAPATAALAVSASTLGLAAAVIPWSVVADRLGRVPAMAVGIIAATAFGLLAPFAPTLPLLLGARLLEGIALGAVPAIALAYLAEEVDAAATAAAAGSYIAGTTIGGLLGRIVAGPFGDVGAWRGGVFAVAVVCAASAALFLVLTPAARGFTPHRLRNPQAPGSSPSLLARLGANLRDGRQLALYAQGFLLMGGFVAVYNFLGFSLSAPPYLLPLWLVSLLFLAYLAGTITSPGAGALAGRFGRRPVLLGALGVMAGGTALTLVPTVATIVIGLLVLTAGFFAAHAIASGWAPVIAGTAGRAQGASLYYLGYYGGSSLFGWSLGYAFDGLGWTGVAGSVLVLIALATIAALVGLPARSTA